ncbi:MAG: hypothetical protein ABSG26_19515 [Bryobacteraceae bacterium]|jgi:hypothetical protein
MGKPKHKQRTLPVALPSTNAIDLFLLAGLPHPLHSRIEEFFQNIAGNHAKVIATPSPSYDGLLYREKTVQALLTAGAQFSARRLKNRSDDQATRPRRIALFYVPAEDDELLLRAFDFFVFPVPLRDLSTFDAYGNQRRHQRDVCEAAIRKGMEVYTRDLVGLLQRRIESRKSHEPLLLPPANFHLEDQRLRHAFCELTRGIRAWANAMPETVSPQMFDHEMLPDFLDHNERQLIFRDSRNVVFPCARPTEFHGAQEIDPAAELRPLRELLRTAYRFGTSLPQGFHHDAQFEGGRHFNQTTFDGSREGEISVTASHVNIYPNDYVRPAS